MREPMIVVTLLLSSMVSMMIAIAHHPRGISCPRGTFASSGIRLQPFGPQPRGFFMCHPPPIGGDDDAKTGRSTARQPPGVFFGILRCADNETPTVRDNASGVTCRRSR